MRTISGVGSSPITWIRVFPALPVTKKPLEVRMGGGKGSPEEWVCPVKPGRVLFELEGVSPEVAERAIKLATYKFGIKTRFISRHEEWA